MLETLSIRDIVLIERLDLDFSSGLNVLTGETGAGKSILLDSLGFALGRRDARGLLREGATEGGATAVLNCPPDHKARALVEEAGVRWDEDGLTLRRVATADGRSRAFVNDQRVSADTLRSIGEVLVEVHGQHDDRGLLNARGHRALLDAFAGSEVDLAATRTAWRAQREAAEALAALEDAQEAALKEQDYIAHSAQELAELSPEVGEDDRLDADRRRMQAGERIREDVAGAASLMGGSGAEGALSDAMRRLDGAAAAAEGRLDVAIEALSRAIEAVGEAGQGVEEALDAFAFDPLALERTEERLFAIRALARKHECRPDDLPGLAASFEARLTDLTDGAARISAARKTLKAAEAAYVAAAKALSARRMRASKSLNSAVAKELPPLKMERAVFLSSVGDGTPGPDGADDVAFLIATNPGSAPGPIGAIASGGELSRFLLAIKVALAGQTSGGAMIFDEIDRGVGGATADAVGKRLSRLAETAQVLVVTHSPQVAAQGDAHFRIQKRIVGKAARTAVEQLDDAARRDEVARMLSGDEITDAARAAADALMG